MTESIIAPIINISSILSTLPDSGIRNIHQKLAKDYNISASRLITAALLSITTDKSVDLNKIKTDVIGIRDALHQKSTQTPKSVNKSLFENSVDGNDVKDYMAKFWTDNMFNNMIQVNKRVYVMFNKISCIRSVNSSKQLTVNDHINAKIQPYNKYQVTRMYHNISSLDFVFSMMQRRRECDFPSSLDKADFELDMSSNAIGAFAKLKRIAIGEDSFVMVKKDNLNQIVKNNRCLNELTLSLTNPNYRNNVKVDAIRSFLNHEDNPAVDSDHKVKLKALKIEYKSDGSDNSKKIASIAVGRTFINTIYHLDLSCFHDDSGALNNVKFPQIIAEKGVQVLTLPKTCVFDLQQQTNNADSLSSLNIETLIFPLPTRKTKAKTGIRLMVNDNDTFKYGYDPCVSQDNKSEQLYAINKFNQSLNLHDSLTSAAMNVNIDLLGSYSIDTFVDIFWGNEYARYRNKFQNLNKLTLFGLSNGDVTVPNIREGKELVQNYIDIVFNNVSMLKGKMDKKDKLTPPNLDSFTTQANCVIRIDDFDPVRAAMSLH